MKKYILTLLLFVPGATLLAQTLSGDSILANERSIDRPITLHARQMRITGGYGLAIISRRYDENGDAIRLRDEGLSSIRHRFSLDLKYGINDFIQVTAAIGQSSTVLREQTLYIFPANPEPIVQHQVLREYSGLEDLYLGLDLRAPLKTRKLDIALSLGVQLPLAASEPTRPDHAFESIVDAGANINKFTYRYNNHLGTGVTVAQFGGMIKYRASKWAISTRVDYRHGLEDGKSFEWQHQLDDRNEFEYRKNPFTYRLRDSFSYFGEVEYQPLPWFDIFLNVSGYSASNGFTTAEADLKIALPDQAHLVVSPGFEIIVTPRLWLRERLDFSVSGTSHEAPFGIQTSVMYNFFPF